MAEKLQQQRYANEQAVVSTQWVADRVKDQKVRIVEVDYDPKSAYELGHIGGAALIQWGKDLNDGVRRDIVSPQGFAALLSRNGITRESTVILYGDFNNWFAAFGYWVFKLYGHKDVRLMNGGRKKWAEEKRSYTTEAPKLVKSVYPEPKADWTQRAYLPQVQAALGKKDWGLVDVRSPAEYKGEITAPPEYQNEQCRVAGHIPGAKSIPWGKAVNEDGTFKSQAELEALYRAEGITRDKSIIAYCRIGERSSHTWFVLKELLGYPKVVNYDGSWTEWGNAVNTPVER